MTVLFRRATSKVVQNVRFFASETTPAKAFDWNSIMSPSTAATTKQAVSEIEKTLSQLRFQASKADSKLEPIDWSKYQKLIKDKKLVEELHKQYDKQIAALPIDDVTPKFMNRLNSELDASIKQAEQAAAISKQLIPKLEQQVQTSNNAVNDRINWNLQQWYEHYPGLAQQHRDEFMDGTYLVQERVARIGNVDPAELRKSIDSGAYINFAELDPKFGDESVEKHVSEIKELETKISTGADSKPEEIRPNLYVDENPGDAVNPDYKPGEHH